MLREPLGRDYGLDDRRGPSLPEAAGGAAGFAGAAACPGVQSPQLPACSFRGQAPWQSELRDLRLRALLATIASSRMI